MTPELSEPQGVVTTIADKCRRCYNCVRSCPAKAIRVQAGQAHVMAERCIGCGNCIKVCAQNAKQVQRGIETVEEFLTDEAPAVAILAPSYPAALEGVAGAQVVAALRRLGFERVQEVGFGAEMVARAYADLVRRPPCEPLISTPCPALISYVTKHLPELTAHLAPVVSPMIALGRAVKGQLLPGARVVFIGPCIAKKAEREDAAVAGAVDAVLTYQELSELLERHGIEPTALPASSPNEPLPYLGGLFPVSGGLLKAASIEADLMDDSVVVVEGHEKCISALRQIRDGNFPARFVDALLCEGCIAGPAFNDNRSPLARKALVTAHVRNLQRRSRDVPRWLRQVRETDVRRCFDPHPVSFPMPTETEIRDILARTNKHSPSDELNCGACGYPTCRDKAIAVYQGLAEQEMCLPYLIDQLEVNLERLGRSKEEIDRAREAATRAQQLASMGRLASDIAHELGNPLSKIIVFARLLADNMPPDDPRREDLTTIVAEAVHSREVLSSLEGFARDRAPQFEDVNIADVVARALEEIAPALALSQATVEQDLEPDLPQVAADPALLSQVLVHLLSNSLDAVGPNGVIRICAAREPDGKNVRIEVIDNGHGIDPALLPRLFEPFVTTKSDRPGAGLGLSASHGIVEAHGGQIDIRSTPHVGTTVTVKLPTHARPVSAARAPKVMVVDDDPDFLEQHRIVLSGMGFEVVCAERSDEALEVANREIPDAFVLDLMMERTDSGARLARALRRDPRFRRAPIIMLTSVVREVGFEVHRNPQEVLDWMKADAWFDKPAPVVELCSTLRRLLSDASRGADNTGAGEPAPQP